MRPSPRQSVPRFHVALEDRFIILRLNEPRWLLPTGSALDNFETCLTSFQPRYTLLFDASGLDPDNIPTDVQDLLKVFSPSDATLLAYERDRILDVIRSRYGYDVLCLRRRLPRLRPAAVPTDVFSDPEYLDEKTLARLARLAHPKPATREEWEFAKSLHDGDPFISFGFRHFDFAVRNLQDFCESPDTADSVLWTILARRLVQQTLELSARNSLLTEFCIQFRGPELAVVPYHSHALYPLNLEGVVVAARPGVLADRLAAVFREDLSAFEDLLNNPRVTEPMIQRFLEQHPGILKALGYRNLYPKVVLQNEKGKRLIPDFLLEPVSTNWCDVLELKLPNLRVAVGRPHRKTLASAIHASVAQLREYAAMFEDPTVTRRVQDRYGIKCYRPRLVAIVGRDPELADERELRRLMTAYADVSVLSFDDLVRVAGARLLI